MPNPIPLVLNIGCFSFFTVLDLFRISYFVFRIFNFAHGSPIVYANGLRRTKHILAFYCFPSKQQN